MGINKKYQNENLLHKTEKDARYLKAYIIDTPYTIHSYAHSLNASHRSFRVLLTVEVRCQVYSATTTSIAIAAITAPREEGLVRRHNNVIHAIFPLS